MKKIIVGEMGTGRLKRALKDAIDFIKESNGKCFIITRRTNLDRKIVPYCNEILENSDEKFNIFGKIEIRGKIIPVEQINDNDVVIYDLKSELTTKYKNCIIIKEK